jgi:hypothetical protein
MLGPTKPFTATVDIRSYSRNSGRSSLDTVT